MSKVKNEKLSIVELPRTNLNYIKTGELYSVSRFGSYYSIFNLVDFDQSILSQKERIELEEQTQTKINFVLDNNVKMFNSSKLFESFLCLNENAIVLRKFKTVIDRKDVGQTLYKHVPVFLFHEKESRKPIIGSIQFDLSRMRFLTLKNEKNAHMFKDDVVCIEAFYEKLM